MNDGELSFLILFSMVYFSLACLYMTKKCSKSNRTIVPMNDTPMENQPTTIINNFISNPPHIVSKTLSDPSHVIIEIVNDPVTKPLIAIGIPIQPKVN